MKKLSITFSMLLIPGMLLAHSERLTIDDLLSAGSRRGGAELSPDGRFFAREENGQIALVPVNGGQANLITSSPKPKSELQWSHDGKHIAYISEGDVWIVASEGGQPQRLTHVPQGRAIRAVRPIIIRVGVQTGIGFSSNPEEKDSMNCM
jgi:dipeptidyl aminopeptidase/acylaminoacyl peptidase